MSLLTQTLNGFTAHARLLQLHALSLVCYLPNSGNVTCKIPLIVIGVPQKLVSTTTSIIGNMGVSNPAWIGLVSFHPQHKNHVILRCETHSDLHCSAAKVAHWISKPKMEITNIGLIFTLACDNVISRMLDVNFAVKLTIGINII